jgi:signal peptidase I
MGSRKSKKPFYLDFLQWLLAATISALLLLLVYNLVGMPFEVKESHICSEYKKGDIIWLNKASAGARVPVIWNPFFYDDQQFKYDRSKYNRLSNLIINRFDPVAYNDIQPINRVPESKPLFISRVIGLPGDTISFYRGTLYINGEACDSTVYEILAYRAHLNNDSIGSLFWDSLEIIQLLSYFDRGTETEISFAAYEDQALRIAGHPATKAFYRLLEERSNPIVYQNGLPDQNGDNYGPVKIPAKGDTLWLNQINEYHANIFADFEAFNTTIPKTSEYWIWQNNYFFVLSDYRKKGHDSRFFGPLPEYLIAAKPGTILFSASE